VERSSVNRSKRWSIARTIFGVSALSVGILEGPSETAGPVMKLTALALSDGGAGIDLQMTSHLNLSIVPVYPQHILRGGDSSMGFRP
jgi:hypothetical protein